MMDLFFALADWRLGFTTIVVFICICSGSWVSIQLSTVPFSFVHVVVPGTLQAQFPRRWDAKTESRIARSPGEKGHFRNFESRQRQRTTTISTMGCLQEHDF